MVRGPRGVLEVDPQPAHLHVGQRQAPRLEGGAAGGVEQRPDVVDRRARDQDAALVDVDVTILTDVRQNDPYFQLVVAEEFEEAVVRLEIRDGRLIGVGDTAPDATPRAA